MDIYIYTHIFYIYLSLSLYYIGILDYFSISVICILIFKHFVGLQYSMWLLLLSVVVNLLLAWKYLLNSIYNYMLFFNMRSQAENVNKWNSNVHHILRSQDDLRNLVKLQRIFNKGRKKCNLEYRKWLERRVLEYQSWDGGN